MTDPLELDDPRTLRLGRVEALLDRWLERFEAALEDAAPDPSRTTELVNVFTILKRIREIEALERKLAAEARHDDTGFAALDPNLFGEAVPGEDGDD